METPNPKINELLNDFYSNLELIVRKAVAEELKFCHPGNTQINKIDNEFLTAEQASIFLGRKLSTLYKDVHLGNIPFHRSGARKLLFSKNELEIYIKQSRVKSTKEIKDDISMYLKSNNGF